MNPKISVIVPVYNVQKYLKACIKSILNQTFTDIEIILVDDGSTDDSGKICDYFKKNSRSIRVIHKKNGGLSEARNEGLKLAQGEYVGFVDSDDIIRKDMYEVLYNLCIENCAEISSCSFKRFEYNYEISNDKIENKNIKIKTYIKNNIIEAYYRGELNSVSSCNKLYRRRLFDNILFPKNRIYEDASTTYKLLLNANKLVETDEDLYFYRLREGSITNCSFNDKRFDIIPLYNEQYKIMSKVYPNICNQIKYEYYHNLRCIFVDIINDNELKNKSNYLIKISKLIKSELKCIFENNLITPKYKVIGIFMAYTPRLIYYLYKYKISRKSRVNNI